MTSKLYRRGNRMFVVASVITMAVGDFCGTTSVRELNQRITTEASG